MKKDCMFYTMLSEELLKASIHALNQAAAINAADLDPIPCPYSPQEEKRMQNAQIFSRVKTGLVESLRQLDYMLECEQSGKNN